VLIYPGGDAGEPLFCGASGGCLCPSGEIKSHTRGEAYGKGISGKRVLLRSASEGTAIVPYLTKFFTITVLFGGITLANCVRIPAADELAQGPQVDEIVRRVKCDLYEAVADRLNAPYGFEWLTTWTAQASLNLIVNDQSQLAPGAVFTQPLLAVTIPQKVTNFSQSANLGLGAQANNTATRNETVTFTVSLQELKDQFGSNNGNCQYPDYIDLRSELGLKEWISASTSPVKSGELAVGYHKTPKTGTAGATTAKQTAATAQDSVAKLKLPLPDRGRQKTPGPIHCDKPDTIPTRTPGPPSLAALANDLPIAYCEIAKFIKGPSEGGIDLSKPLDGDLIKFTAQTIRDIDRAIADLMFMQNETGELVRTDLKNFATDLAVFVDPPIDTISHQVQFIIVWNASATPSWTLVNFKGPSPSSGALFSATKTKTHTLNVVIGPPSSLDSQSALAALQIGTAVGNALTSGGLSAP
jgi:hypothetical protein